MEHGRRAEEEEEEHGKEAEGDDDDGEADEDGGRPERRVQDRAEVLELALADDLLAALHEAAVLPQPEVARALRLHRVPDPLRLDEHHHVNDCEAEGEHPARVHKQ